MDGELRAMTADRNNEKLKYGHEVPRSWIPDFNATHPKQEAKPVDAPELLSELDKAVRHQRRAIRQGKAKPVRLKQTEAGTPRLLATIGGLMLGGAVASAIAFQAIGSRVDEKGVLQEPFFLLPTSALLAFGGSVSLAGAALARRKQRW